MSELKTNLQEILQEKQDKIIPGNIKKDVQIFDVIGTYEGSGSSEGVKLFETQEEMQADTNAQEGDLAVVYREETQNMTADTQTQYITFPETVTLPSVITESYYCMLRAVDTSTMFDGQVQLSASSFSFDGFGDSGMIAVQYSSADGINYTRTTFSGDAGDLTNPVDFGTTIQVDLSGGWDDNIGYFMQAGESTFEGLYEYDGIQYNIVETQLDATADLLYNSIAYGKNGVIEGTITQNVSNSFVDINAEIYYKIQQAYDNMQPRVLTDSDKTIDKNIYFIPTNANGEPLLDTSKVTNMQSMFYGCSNLTTIPLLDTSKVTNMQSMFSICTNLQSVPLLDTSKVTTMQSMFSSCINLQSVPLLDTSQVTNMQSMFYGCSNLQSVLLLDTSKVTTMKNMFNSCTNLTTIPQLNTSQVTDMMQMFSGCANLQSISLLDTSKVTDMRFMFHECTNLTTIPQLNTSQVTDMYSMFKSCTNLTTIPQLNTGKVTDMSSMFRSCTNLQSVPSLNTSSATNMQGMFSDCTNLQSVPSLNTSSATNMSVMFSNCTNLQSVPLLDTSNVTNMSVMFYGCDNLNNESLNNILQMCINATKVTTSKKTLKSIGLSETQAQTCATLSNYQAFLDAGWTTGY